MCWSLLVSLVLNYHLFSVSHAATIPTGSLLAITNPILNISSLGQTFQPNQNTSDNPNALAVRPDEPWPPAPFDYNSEGDAPGWSLHIVSYDDAQLTYLEKRAIQTICVDYIEALKIFGPHELVEENTFTMRTVGILALAGIEIAFYNSADEPGTRYTFLDMVYVLKCIVEPLLTLDPVELTRIVSHLANALPRNEGKTFRKVMVQKTATVASE